MAARLRAAPCTHRRDSPPHSLSRSRVDFKYTLMGKPVMLYYLEKGLCDGWDDPRMPTVRGLLRHGMTVEALRVFMNQQGSSRNLVNLDWSTVWAVNRKVRGLGLKTPCPFAYYGFGLGACMQD